MDRGTKIAAWALAGSLAGLAAAKWLRRDGTAWVLVGGFVGRVVGEKVVDRPQPLAIGKRKAKD